MHTTVSALFVPVLVLAAMLQGAAAPVGADLPTVDLSGADLDALTAPTSDDAADSPPGGNASDVPVENGTVSDTAPADTTPVENGTAEDGVTTADSAGDTTTTDAPAENGTAEDGVTTADSAGDTTTTDAPAENGTAGGNSTAAADPVANETDGDNLTAAADPVANETDGDGSTAAADPVANGTAGENATASENADESGENATASENATGPTVVHACTVIDAPGSYVLAGDLTAVDGVCLAVTASDVLIDGAGHTVDGVDGHTRGPRTGHAGVLVYDPDAPEGATGAISDVTVRNLTIVEFGHGIEARGARGVVLRDVTLESNRVGVKFSDVDNVTVVDVTVSDSAQHGFRTHRSRAVTLRESTVADSGRFGLHVTRGTGLRVIDSDVSGNGVGVRVKRATGTVVSGNAFSANGVAVSLQDVDGATVRENLVVGGTEGIVVGETDEPDGSGHGDGHAGGRGSGESGGHDDGHESGESGGHDDGHESGESGGHDDGHGGVSPGDVLLASNIVRNVAGAGIVVTETPDVTVTDTVVSDSGEWDLVLAGESPGLRVEDLTLDSAVVSLTGRDASLRAVSPVDLPGDPVGHENVGTYFEVATRGPDGLLDVGVSFDGRWSDTADSLRLWRYGDDHWVTVPGTDDWRYDSATGAWVPSGTNEVDADAGEVRARVETGGILAPLTNSTPSGTANLSVSSVDLRDATLTAGQSATVDATVSNTGDGDADVLVELVADGSVVATETVPIPAGGTETVTLTRQFDEAGTYALSVGAMSTERLVVRPARSRGGGARSLDTPHVDVRTEGGIAHVNVRLAQRGEQTDVTFDMAPLTDSGLALRELGITTDRDEYYRLTVRQREDESPPLDRPGRTFGYLTVEHSVDDRHVTGANVTFEIARESLAAAGVDAKSVTLYRHVDDEWVPLPTGPVETTGDRLVFRASSPGLSRFAVGTAAPENGTAPSALVTDVRTDDRVDVGESTRLVATVRNDGRVEVTTDVELVVDDVTVERVAVTVPANDSREVRFEYTFDVPGEHAVDVNGRRTSVSVASPVTSTTPAETVTTPTESLTDTPVAAESRTAAETSPHVDEGQTATRRSPGFGLAVAVLALALFALLPRGDGPRV
ncbi:MAG: right-handed parallel beta-helix repeat-containing protein [Haloferacaceae archaeon]